MSSFRRNFTLYTVAPGAYINGRWQEGMETSMTLQASLQPVNQQDLAEYMQLDKSGRYISKAYRLYSSQKVDLENGKNAAQIEIYGERYEILHVSSWQNGVINHYKLIAVKYDS